VITVEVNVRSGGVSVVGPEKTQKNQKNPKKTQKKLKCFFCNRVRNTKQQQNTYDEIFLQPHENPPEQAESQSR
jgi:hypothetical protein